jgi:copper chaperone CopZ
MATDARTQDVPAISCEHCKHAIESEVAAVEGVDAAKVDVAAKMVAVFGVASESLIGPPSMKRAMKSPKRRDEPGRR